MPLTEEQFKIAKSWMSKKNVSGECQACGQSNWEFQSVIASPSLDEKGNICAGPLIPMVPSICTNCGFIRLYSAVMMGIVSKK